MKVCKKGVDACNCNIVSMIERECDVALDMMKEQKNNTYSYWFGRYTLARQLKQEIK